MLQNPSDSDATFRVKANKQHREYVANLTETVVEKGSLITDYQYDVNTHSDASFMKESIENTEPSDTEVTIITDGAYNSEEIRKLAAEKIYESFQQNFSEENPGRSYQNSRYRKMGNV